MRESIITHMIGIRVGKEGGKGVRSTDTEVDTHPKVNTNMTIESEMIEGMSAEMTRGKVEMIRGEVERI